VRAALLRWDRSLYEAITALKRGYLAWRVPKKDLCGQDREEHGDCAKSNRREQRESKWLLKHRGSGSEYDKVKHHTTHRDGI
jgi:hypothetical protein